MESRRVFFVAHMNLKTQDLLTFRWMQEAELKHSRIAMVSVCLWPLSELDCLELSTSRLGVWAVGRWGLGGWGLVGVVVIFLFRLVSVCRFCFFGWLVNSFYRVVSCCLLPIPIYKAETLQMSAMRILHLFAIDEMVDKSLKQCDTLPQHHPNICVGRFADAILDPVRQSQAPVRLNTDILLMYFGRFMFSWTILYQLKRAYLYNALQKTNIQHSRIPHGYFKCHPYPTIQLQQIHFFESEFPKKTNCQQRCRNQNPGFSDFPLGHLLAMGSLAAALPEMSKMPGVATGILWFRSFELEGPKRQPETANPETAWLNTGFPGLRKGGGFGTRGHEMDPIHFWGVGSKLMSHALVIWSYFPKIVQCLGWWDI